MKFLLISDNHGHYNLVQEIIRAFGPQVDYIFHCGDSEFPYEDSIWQQVDLKVKGNMDFYPAFPDSETIETPVGKVVLVHGHKHHVNQSNQGVLELAQNEGAKFAFHGHTHKLYAEYRQGVLLVNPGSLAHSRGPVNARTFAIVVISDNGYRVDYYDETRAYLESLSQYFEINGADSL